jgi:hypothetical protein
MMVQVAMTGGQSVFNVVQGWKLNPGLSLLVLRPGSDPHTVVTWLRRHNNADGMIIVAAR